MSGKLRRIRGRRARPADRGEANGDSERSLGLVLAASMQGLVAVLLALFSAMNAAALVLGEGQRGTHAGALLLEAVGAIAIAALAAGVLFWRRWAGDLSLAVARAALWVGANAMVLELAAAPRLLARLDHSPTVVHAHLTLGVLLSTMLLLFVALPLGFALFYRRPAVMTAFRRGDPESRWTDRHPPSILLFFVALLAAAALVLAASAAGFSAGHWRGASKMLVVGFLAVACAWGTLRRKRWAWLGSIALLVAALVTSSALAWLPALGQQVAALLAAGQGATVRFYLGSCSSRVYQGWLALQALLLILVLWRLRGHFRRALEIVARGPGRQR